jgi:hypothetical protein
MDNILTFARSVLETTPKHWIRLAEGLPDELLGRPPALGEWSALECLHHLVDTERDVFPARIGFLMEGKDFPAFDPDAQGSKIQKEKAPIELAREFERLREKALQWFEKISAADLDRQARHSELGMVTLEELLNEWAAHDLMHTVQAERALMQPFIAGSGPWKQYFSDHWVREESG